MVCQDTQTCILTARLQSACKKNDISSLHANKELSYCEPIKELCLTRRTSCQEFKRKQPSIGNDQHFLLFYFIPRQK